MRSYPHLLEFFQAHRSRLHPSICLPVSYLAVVPTERPGSRSPQRADRVTSQLGRPDALSLSLFLCLDHSTVRPRCPARNLLNSTLALVFAFAICLGPHLCRRHAKLPSVFVSIISKRTQSECDVAHKVQRQSSAESAWRIPNAVLVAKDVVISIITKGFQPGFFVTHKPRRW